ncbi:MAG: adenylate/guanylate cyclase domain-containing protein [Arenicellales bacterium]|nr:adenylate/guanylate cyclase domain-containing protein [Arenicellales bacterium]
MAVDPSRKLAVILHADVAGSTGLVQRDESVAHKRIQDSFRRLSETIKAYGGTPREIRGDALVAEFGRASDAVTAAIVFQIKNTDFNAQLDDDIRPELRMGISLGEVIVADNTVTGEGIVLAQRLEQLAVAGGVVVQGSVTETVPSRLPFDFDSLGEQTLKGFDQPVRAFVVRLKPGAQIPGSESKAVKPEIETHEQPTSDLPDKPSIIVLPFTNMSGDPEQEYFGDGITEDIITALSQFRELLVIARNTSFCFKGKAMRVDSICKELNVRYALEGSVRKAANRVRVTAQLIDGRSDTHIWAERFDRNLDDIFLVQDEITAAIVTAVAPRTLSAEVKRAHAKTIDDLSARERVMRARWHINKLTKADNELAHGLLDEAIAVSPDLAEAYTTRAECLLNDILHIWRDDTDVANSEALDAAQHAVSLDPEDANGLAVLGSILLWARQFEDAREYLERAVRLNPNLANAYGLMAVWYGLCGDYEKSCEAADKALEISPLDSSKPLWLGGRGIAAYIHGDYELVIETAQRLLRDHPGFASALRQLAASFAMLGRDDEAKAAVQKLLERMPGLTVSKVRHIVPIRDPDAHERWLEGFRKAGLPA